MDGITDQSQGPRRQHSMISRSPAFSTASGEALGVGEQSQDPKCLQASSQVPCICKQAGGLCCQQSFDKVRCVSQ